MGVLNSFQNASQKVVLNQLDEVTLQSISHQFVVQSCSSFLYFFSLFDEECIDYSRSCPVLICNMCLGVFHHIPSFQVHIQTCCSPPSTKFQSKLDWIYQLAPSGSKSFSRRFARYPPTASSVIISYLHLHWLNFISVIVKIIVKYEDQLHTELDVLWQDCTLDGMLNCREIFLRAATAIASHKWVSLAIANEYYRTGKIRQLKVGHSMFRPLYFLSFNYKIQKNKGRVAEWSALPTGMRGDPSSIPAEVNTFFGGFN